MGRRARGDVRRPREGAALTAFVDTNVVVRHLVGDPVAQARRATAALASTDTLLLTEVVFAECIYVLESYYEIAPAAIAAAMRALLAMDSVLALEAAALHRSLELYEHERLHFAEAHLVANAEAAGVADVLSFDRDLLRVPTIRRVEP